MNEPGVPELASVFCPLTLELVVLGALLLLLLVYNNHGQHVLRLLGLNLLTCLGTEPIGSASL